MTPDLVARIAPLAPCYVYEQSLIRESLSKLRRAFASCRFLYSVKANPFAAVLREAALAGFGTDAASAEEVRLSLEAGIEPDDIYYSAPGKTPQDIALIDAVKGVNMFKRVEVPILGIVENMSYYLCPQCGHKEFVFGEHGAKETAEQMGETFLGEIPLHYAIRENSDNGTPIVFAEPDSPYTQAYMDIAQKILQKL